MEQWKDIKGYEGLYQVSNLGRVRSLNYRQSGEIGLLKLTTNNGYKKCRLFIDGIGKTESVHRLVAEAFISNPNNLPTVNHKNEIKTDNRIENLEWCTQLYNNNYGTRGERQLENNHQRIEVEVDSIKFMSISAAAQYLNSHQFVLSKALRKGRTTFKGHKIGYVN